MTAYFGTYPHWLLIDRSHTRTINRDNRYLNLEHTTHALLDETCSHPVVLGVVTWLKPRRSLKYNLLASQTKSLCTAAELEEVVLEIEIPTRQDDNIHFDRDSGHVDEVRKIEILCLFRTSVVIGLISHSQDLLDQLVRGV